MTDPSSKDPPTLEFAHRSDSRWLLAGEPICSLRIEQKGRLTPLRRPGGHHRYALRILNACLAQDLCETRDHQE